MVPCVYWHAYAFFFHDVSHFLSSDGSQQRIACAMVSELHMFEQKSVLKLNQHVLRKTQFARRQVAAGFEEEEDEQQLHPSSRLNQVTCA